ncbi:hypothetical protein CYMTET_34597 [Cymbomonas tetramitiformis]|uniref:Uncharacterized protein n=1 Tax=Cymbomonas tetramitiformis TaxID=36881 RepID=A0AAE0FB13_9CHLO|nr:hypothetical protein CYMTET_34597 [Cymbomonas tetramitiformis]
MPEICIRVVTFWFVLLWGLLKGLVTALLASCICTFGNIGAALWHSFSHLYLVGKAVSQTSIIGPNLKALLLLLAPGLIWTWLGLVVLFSYSTSFVYGFGYGCATTVMYFLNSAKWFELDLGTPTTACKTVVQDFSDFCAYSVPAYCEDLRNAEWEHPVDLPLVDLITQLLNTVFIICFSMIAYLILSVFRFPVLLVRLAWVTARLFCEFRWWNRVPLTFVVTISVVPTVAAAWVGLAAPAGAVIGLWAGIVGAVEGASAQGWQCALSYVGKYDAALNHFCFGCKRTCFPTAFHPTNETLRRLMPATYASSGTESSGIYRELIAEPLDDDLVEYPSVPVDNPAGDARWPEPPPGLARAYHQVVTCSTVWNNLFEQCIEAGCHMRNCGVIEEGDLEDYAPFLFIGLPGLVVLRAIWRSIDGESEGLILGDGQSILPSSRPAGIIADQFWTSSMDLKAKLVGLHLTQAERIYLEVYTCTMGDRAAANQAMGGAPALNESMTDSSVYVCGDSVIMVDAPSTSADAPLEVPAASSEPVEEQRVGSDVAATLTALDASPAAAPRISQERQVELHRVAAKIQSIGSELSRIPTFRRRFMAVLDGIEEAATGRGSPV